MGLEQNFSKNAQPPKEKPKKLDDVKKDTVKLLRITTDEKPELRGAREASLKQLMSTQEVAKAIMDLDDAALTLDHLCMVRQNACPNPKQLLELQEARRTQPNVPMALPEQYMWVLGQIPACQQRIKCWEFVRTYKERTTSYVENLKHFEAIVECFRSSKMLPSILGLVLAVGNYLNGDSNRGQADGFDIETLGKLETVKGADARDIRHFIFKVYFNNLETDAAILIEELAPCFGNVSRNLNKNSDGTEILSKGAR